MTDESKVDENSIDFKLDFVACAVADAFVDAYYQAIRADRHTLSTFYCAKTTDAEGNVFPTIAWNGTTYHEPAEFQTFVQDLTYLNFDVEDLDCHVLNPKCIPADKLKGGSGDDEKDLERRMSITVLATGSLRVKEQLKGPLRTFADSFVLVPNPENEPEEALPDKVVDKDTKAWTRKWLIQNQNFRFTEWSQEEITNTTLAETKRKDFSGKPIVEANGVKRNAFTHLAAAGLLGKGKEKAKS